VLSLQIRRPAVGKARILHGTREPDVVAGIGQIHVRQNKELNEKAEAYNVEYLREHGRADERGKLRAEIVCKADEQRPADKAQIHHEQLTLMSGHDALAFRYALQCAHLRMLKQQIQRLAVAVERDKARDYKQQRPQEDENALKDVQPDDAKEHSKRVEDVPAACLHAAYRAQAEDRKARTEDQRYDLYGKIKDRRAGGGHSLLYGVGKLIGIYIAVIFVVPVAEAKVYAELIVHRLKLYRRAADELIRKEAEHRKNQKIDDRGDNRLGSGSPYKGF